MLPVGQYPFFRIALVFALGIGGAVAFPACMNWISGPLVLGLATIYAVVYWALSFTGKHFWLGTLGVLLCLATGVYVTKQHTGQLDALHISNRQGVVQGYVAVVGDEVVHRKKSFSTELHIQAVRVGNQWQKAIGTVQVYIKSRNGFPMRYGDVVVVKGGPMEIDPPRNSGEFDYRRFMAYKNIYHRQFLDSLNYRIIGNAPPSGTWKWAFSCRDYLSGTLQKFLGSGEIFMVASMLILGIRHYVDPELMKAYAVSGAIHVLSVSGLHVGLVFFLFQWLLGRWMARSAVGKHLFYIVSIMAIWLFGLITAFSPSVLRAVIMFTVVLVGKWANKKGNLYNTLGFTSFAILLFSPYTLLNVGFQLSFMAVLGIAWFQPLLSPLVAVKHPVWKWMWEITCVSLSAQLATFPLALLYFNQFPTYFLLSNLWVVPAGTVILYVGLLFLAIPFWAFGQNVLAAVLHYAVWLLNQSLYLVAGFSGASIHTLGVGGWEVVLLYGMLGCSALLFYLRDRRYLLYGLALALVFTTMRIAAEVNRDRSKQLVVFHVGRHVCLGVLQGREARVFADRGLLEDPSSLDFSVRSPLLLKGFNEIAIDTLPDHGGMLNIDGFRCMILRQELSKDVRLRMDEVDLVYLSFPCGKFTDFVALQDVQLLVHSWKGGKGNAEPPPNAWNIQSQGAFVLDL